MIERGICCLAFCMALIFAPNQTFAQNAKPAQVVVEMGSEPVAGNRLKLVLVPYYTYGNPVRNAHIAVEAVGNKGVFKFKLPAFVQVSYMIIYIPGADPTSPDQEKLDDIGLLSPGDSLSMRLARLGDKSQDRNKYVFSYSGRGALPMRCIWEMSYQTYHQPGSGLLVDSAFNLVPDYAGNTRTAVALRVLGQYKDSLPASVYDLLWVDTKTDMALKKYYRLRKLWVQYKDNDSIHARIREYYQKFVLEEQGGSNLSKAKSIHYGYNFMEQTIVKILAYDPPMSYEKLYAICKQQPEPVRARLIVDFFDMYGMSLNKLDSLVKDALTVVKAPPFSAEVVKFNNHKAGSPVYPLILTSDDGKKVNIADFKGKVVFIDWWFTGCTACALYYSQHLKAVQEAYQSDTSVVFLSISVDRSATQWKKSIASGKYTSAAAINLYTNGLGNDHPAIRFYNFQGYPRKMIVDTLGLLSAYNNHLLGDKFAVRAAIERLKPRKATVHPVSRKQSKNESK